MNVCWNEWKLWYVSQGSISSVTKKGTVTLTKNRLLDRILESMEMVDHDKKCTPMDKEPLSKNSSGPPCVKNWSYRSIIGMQLYLA